MTCCRRRPGALPAGSARPRSRSRRGRVPGGGRVREQRRARRAYPGPDPGVTAGRGATRRAAPARGRSGYPGRSGGYPAPGGARRLRRVRACRRCRGTPAATPRRAVPGTPAVTRTRGDREAGDYPGPGGGPAAGVRLRRPPGRRRDPAGGDHLTPGPPGAPPGPAGHGARTRGSYPAGPVRTAAPVGYPGRRRVPGPGRRSGCRGSARGVGQRGPGRARGG